MIKETVIEKEETMTQLPFKVTKNTKTQRCRQDFQFAEAKTKTRKYDNHYVPA
jgi:hypothetical protein